MNSMLASLVFFLTIKFSVCLLFLVWCEMNKQKVSTLSFHFFFTGWMFSWTIVVCIQYF